MTAVPYNNTNLAQHLSPPSHKQGTTQGPQILIEDFDEVNDAKFIKEYLEPYLSDLYKDLALRSFVSAGATNVSLVNKRVDRVTFTQYCNLPGLIGERLLKLFDTNNDGQITEKSFVGHMTQIFVSNLETRMRITFNM